MIYEIMYIVPSRYSETEVEGAMQAVQGYIEKHGGKVEKADNLGRMKFAYPIKKNTHGTYVLMYTELEGEAVAKIDTELRLADEVLRHLIVKREKGIPTFEWKMTQYQAPITAEGKRAAKLKVAPKSDAPKAPAVKAEPLSEEEIDKKIDEVLDGEVDNV